MSTIQDKTNVNVGFLGPSKTTVPKQSLNAMSMAAAAAASAGDSVDDGGSGAARIKS